MEQAVPHIEGYMLKLGDKGLVKTWKKRYFLPRKDRLLYYVKKGDEAPISSISLRKASSIEPGRPASLPLRKSYDHCLDIKLDNRTYHLACDTPDQRDNWIAVLWKLKHHYENLDDTVNEEVRAALLAWLASDTGAAAGRGAA